MRAETALCHTKPGLALLWDPPPFDYSPLLRGVQGSEDDLRPQETEGHKLEEFGPFSPCVEVFPLNTHTGTLGEQETKNKNKTTLLLLYHPEFGVC